MDIKINKKVVPLLLTGTIVLAGGKLYQNNKTLSYSEITNPKKIESIQYINYKSLSIEEFKKSLEDDSEKYYLIEYSTDEEKGLKRYYFSKDYILYNKNNNVLEAIKNGTIIVNNVWEVKNENTENLDIDETFFNENLCNSFTIIRKDPNYPRAEIHYIEDEDGNFQLVYDYVKKEKINGFTGYSHYEFLGPLYESNKNKDKCNLNDYAIIIPYYEKSPFIIQLENDLIYKEEKELSFNELKKLNVNLLYFNNESKIKTDELQKIIDDDNIYDCSITLYRIDEYTKGKTSYYNTSKRRIQNSEDKAIEKYINSGSVIEVRITYHEIRTKITDEMIGKNFTIANDNEIIFVKYNKKTNTYHVKVTEKEYTKDKVKELRKNN